MRTPFLWVLALAAGLSAIAEAADAGLKKAVKIEMVAEGDSLQDKFGLLKELGFDGVELPSPNGWSIDEVVAARERREAWAAALQERLAQAVGSLDQKLANLPEVSGKKPMPAVQTPIGWPQHRPPANAGPKAAPRLLHP